MLLTRPKLTGDQKQVINTLHKVYDVIDHQNAFSSFPQFEYTLGLYEKTPAGALSLLAILAQAGNVDPSLQHTLAPLLGESEDYYLNLNQFFDQTAQAFYNENVTPLGTTAAHAALHYSFTFLTNYLTVRQKCNKMICQSYYRNIDAKLRKYLKDVVVIQKPLPRFYFLPADNYQARFFGKAYFGRDNVAGYLSKEHAIYLQADYCEALCIGDFRHEHLPHTAARALTHELIHAYTPDLQFETLGQRIINELMTERLAGLMRNQAGTCSYGKFFNLVYYLEKHQGLASNAFFTHLYQDLGFKGSEHDPYAAILRIGITPEQWEQLVEEINTNSFYEYDHRRVGHLVKNTLSQVAM